MTRVQRPRLRRLGHRARATLSFGVAAALASALLAVVAYTSSRTYLTDQRERNARERAYVNARSVRDQLRGAGAEPGATLAALASEDDATALLRVDGDWYSSSVAIEADDLPRDVIGAVESGAAAWQRYELRGKPRLAVAVPIPAAGAVYAEVVPLDELATTLGTLGRSLLVAAGATTLAGGVLGFLAAGRLVRPLRRLAEQAELVAAGQGAELDAARGDPDLQPLVRSMNRLLEESSRRAEQGSRFVSDVSHEIRAPLAALAAATEIMQRRRAQLPERSAHALDLLVNQIDEFQRLVLDLLEISRIDAGRAELVREPTRWRDLLAAATDALGVDVPIHIADDVPAAMLLDRRRMGQIVVNLLENARRYAGGATEISVTSPRAGVVEVAVSDRGPGVPIDERSRIFGRFERGEHGERGPGGSGLGLALAAEHAALHGGRLSVRDACGGGATFVVEVPVCAPE